jgi:membrane protease YdiL (CAAX protease family)
MPVSNHLALYAVLIALEIALGWWATRSLRRRNLAITDVTGRWRTARDAARDIALAAAMWGVWWAFSRATATPARPGVRSMLPVGAAESALWIVLSCAAGFAEELAFRGALQQALTRRFGTALAIVGQAVIFGVVHAYQGGPALLRIIAYGLLFGAVAHWRRRVAPGMIAHAWTDIAAGLLRW